MYSPKPIAPNSPTPPHPIFARRFSRGPSGLGGLRGLRGPGWLCSMYLYSTSGAKLTLRCSLCSFISYAVYLRLRRAQVTYNEDFGLSN